MASWNYSNQSDPNAQTGVINGSQFSFSQFGDIDQGYYVTYPIEPGSTPPDLINPVAVAPYDPAGHSASGYLACYFPNLPDIQQIDIWITQAQISLTTGGTFAQSPRLRQFFPRNFVQPVWTIQGIVPNSFQLQRLAEFIRRTQFAALNPVGLTTTTTHLCQFYIAEGHLGDLQQITQENFKKLGKRQKEWLNKHPQTVQGKGPHKAQKMQGYIQSFSRGAQKFINAPTYEFDFVVAFSQGDLLVTQNWADIQKQYNEISSIQTSYLGTGQANRVAPPPNV
jgi:hypothetical protein